MAGLADFPTARINSPDGVFSVDVCPAAGGCVTAFRRTDPQTARTADVLRAFRSERLDGAITAQKIACLSGSFPMVPYSNRIAGGRLTVGKHQFQVGPLHGAEPNALHGDGWRSPWLIEDRSDSGIVLRRDSAPKREGGADDTPYGYTARQFFALDDRGLTMDMEITNRAGRKLPFGIGQHTYFDLVDGGTVLKTKLDKVWRGGAAMIPDHREKVPDKWNFRHGRTLSVAALGPPEEGFAGSDLMDNCFSGIKPLKDGAFAHIDYPAKDLRIVLKGDPDTLRHVVMYMPARPDFFAYEMVPNVIDGFNKKADRVKGTGTKMLKDGESMYVHTRIEARPLTL